MKRSKFLFQFISVLAFTFVLFSCKPPEDIVIDEPDFVEEGATKIKVWTMDFEEWNNQIAVKQRKDFNSIDDDGIQVEQEFIDPDIFEDRIRVVRELNEAPDVYMVSYGNLYKEIKNGTVAELTNLLPQSAWDDLQENAKNGVMYDGKYYGYPQLMEPSSLLFYRKDLLEEYGETTTPPATWDELYTVAAKIKENAPKGTYPFDVPKGIALGWATWGLQYNTTGGFAITEDWATSRIDEGYEDLAMYWKELYSNSYVPISSGDYTEIIDDLCQNKLVMTTAGSWSIAGIINTYPDLVDKIGIAPIPTKDGDHSKPTATNGGWVYVIDANSSNKEEAAAYVEWLLAGSVDQPLEYFEGARFSKASPRISVQNAIDEMKADQDTVPIEWINTISDVASKAPLEPIYPWDISIAVSSLLENAALGEDVSEELSSADNKIKDIITNQNLANNNPRG